MRTSLIRIGLRILVLAIVIGVVQVVIPEWQITGGQPARLWVAILLAAANTVLGPVFRVIKSRSTAAGYGVFLLVANGLLALIAAGLTAPVAVKGFWWALLAGLIIGACSWITEFALPISKKKGSKSHG